MSAAPTSKQLTTRLAHAAQLWPSDPVRPHLQLKTFLASLAEHPSLTPKAVTAVEALRSDVYAKKYLLSDRTMKPASSPHHYERLREGYEKAIQGIKRPWWKIFFNVW